MPYMETMPVRLSVIWYQRNNPLSDLNKTHQSGYRMLSSKSGIRENRPSNSLLNRVNKFIAVLSIILNRF
jgi:hypothetical protein